MMPCDGTSLFANGVLGRVAPLRVEGFMRAVITGTLDFMMRQREKDP